MVPTAACSRLSLGCRRRSVLQPTTSCGQTTSSAPPVTPGACADVPPLVTQLGDSAHPGPPCSSIPEQVGCVALGAQWVPDPVSRGCHPAHSPAPEMCPGHRTRERTKPASAEPAQPLQHGAIAEGPCSVLLGAVGSDGAAAAGRRGWGTHHSTPLPAPAAACASLEEPQGAMWPQATGTTGTPPGRLWAMAGAAAIGRGYGSCPPPELCGLPGRHDGCSWYPPVRDAPACAAYNAGAGMWARVVPGDPTAAGMLTAGGPGTRSPSTTETPGAESPQPCSELPFPVMPQEGPRVRHPRNRGTAVGGLLSL